MLHPKNKLLSVYVMQDTERQLVSKEFNNLSENAKAKPA